MEKIFRYANRTLFLITLIAFIVIAILIAMILQFSKDLYYYTLSSISQGLFSMLALAGIFVIFRIEQLSKDEAKYETDFKENLREIRNQTIPILSTIKFHQISIRHIMERNEHDTILKLLDERKFGEYSEELNKLEQKINVDDKEFEEELNKLTSEIKKQLERGRKPTIGTIRIDMRNIDEWREEKTRALEVCYIHVRECKKKGDLINYNRALKNKILEFFKYPFILGMILIAFTIFFLPMLSSNSGFWLQIPGNYVIGFLVSLTIMVILTIMLSIYYSMWSDEAMKTLI